jgi:hypothetical protein
MEGSPIVQALVEEGDDAFGPLIEDLEHETRLTRSVGFWRDYHRSRNIMGAPQAVITALSGIMKTPFYGAALTDNNLSARSLQGRKAFADRVRAYWEKNRSVPLTERWYRVLADDRAAPHEWLQAARDIVQRENATIVPGSTAFTATVTTQLPPGARPRLGGEALREKRNLSVAELLARRVNQIDPGRPLDAQLTDQSRVSSANQMATMLAEWDSKAALPVLKARMERCVRVVQDGQASGRRPHGMEAAIASLTSLRNRLGDPEALNDYAAWVRTVTPGQFGLNLREIFEPLWRHPDHPAIIAATAALFEDPKSPWNPSVRLETDRDKWLPLLGSPLLGLKSFRAVVVGALADKTQVGTVETDAQGRVIVIKGRSRSVSYDDSVSVSGNSSGDPTAPRESPLKPGSSAMPLRKADEVCESLQQLEGIPRFRKQWPVARRDEALAACIAYLNQYGERFRENEASRAIRATEPGAAVRGTAILTFDPLDHPATADDVAAGRAVFSLEGAGAEVHRCPLPPFPLGARWTKLEVFRNDPPVVRVFDKEGHEYPNTETLQVGRVWQAEEVREGDRWRRYYGFVGRHALTRVAAEEIEFRTYWREGWSVLSTDLDGRIVIKEAATTGPLPVEFSFRNHRGVETTAPADLVRGGDGAPTIREGIAFRLVRESDKPEAPNPFAEREGARETPFPPEEISARPFRRHPNGVSSRILAPAGTVVAFRLDLHTLFPIDRPGRYRLEITFDDLKTRNGTPGKVETVFPVVVRKAE